MASGHKDGSIFLWDVSSWKPISAFSTDTDVKSVALTSSGSLIAAGSRGGAVRLWDVETRRERAAIVERSAGAMAFHPDDDRIAVTLFGYSILIVHVGGGANPRVLEGHTTHIMSLAFSPDGSMLASGSFDGSVRVWDVNGKAEPRILVGHKVTSGRHGGLQGIRTVAFSRDGGLVASGAEDGTAWLWHARTGVQRRPFVTGQHPVKRVACSPDGIWLALGTRGSVSVRSLHGDEVRIFQGAADSIRAVAWLPAATILAIASDEAIDLWNVVTGEVRRVLTVVRSSGRKLDV